MPTQAQISQANTGLANAVANNPKNIRNPRGSSVIDSELGTPLSGGTETSSGTGSGTSIGSGTGTGTGNTNANSGTGSGGGIGGYFGGGAGGGASGGGEAEDSLDPNAPKKPNYVLYIGILLAVIIGYKVLSKKKK